MCQFLNSNQLASIYHHKENIQAQILAIKNILHSKKNRSKSFKN